MNTCEFWHSLGKEVKVLSIFYSVIIFLICPMSANIIGNDFNVILTERDTERDTHTERERERERER